MNPAELPIAWRARAAELRRFGAEPQAVAVEACADELASALCEHDLEALTLEQAAAESGYTYSAIEKGVRAGRIPNAGTKGAPRVRRRDLPRKRPKADSTEGPDFAARLRSV
jgi:hypothetical protein